MAKQLYGLSLEDVRILRELIRWWRGRGGSRRPVPTRRRNRGGGGKRMNVIHGQAVGAMSGGTHDLDNIQVMNGADPREDPEDDEETVEVSNPFGYTTDDNGLVRAEQADDGTWIVTDAQCPE